MERLMPGLTGLAGLACIAAAPATAANGGELLGIWGNPNGTLAVRTEPCGGGLCGAIVWANAGARSDARAAGVDPLIGTQLLQDYRPAGDGAWAGRVYVPDMGRSFSSRIRQVAPDRLKISGCLIGHYLCRSQEWHRLN